MHNKTIETKKCFLETEFTFLVKVRQCVHFPFLWALYVLSLFAYADNDKRISLLHGLHLNNSAFNVLDLGQLITVKVLKGY